MSQNTHLGEFYLHFKFEVNSFSGFRYFWVYSSNLTISFQFLLYMGIRLLITLRVFIRLTWFLKQNVWEHVTHVIKIFPSWYLSLPFIHFQTYRHLARTPYVNLHVWTIISHRVYIIQQINMSQNTNLGQFHLHSKFEVDGFSGFRFFWVYSSNLPISFQFLLYMGIRL